MTFVLGTLLKKDQQIIKGKSIAAKILIDCGSWNIRIMTPYGQYVGESSVLAADKRTVKSPFERNIIINFSHLEKLLDQCLAFCLEEKESDKPLEKYDLVMTLPFGYPLEEQLRDFLMYTYNIFRSITFLPDFLLALRSVSSDTSIEYILHFGNYSTHVARIRGNEIEKILRMNFGATTAAEMLIQLLALKYPGSSIRNITVPQAIALISAACHCALDYHAELPTFIEENKFVIKDPNYQAPSVVDQAAQQKTLEKRQEMAERLRERAHQKRLEKLQAKEAELESLRKAGENTKQLEKEIQLIKSKIDPTMEVEIEEEQVNYDFSLLEIPDDQLDSEHIKEKRRLRLIKASADARERQKLEKKQLEEKQRLEKEADDQFRISNFEEWRKQKLELRQQILKSLTLQRKRKIEMTGRKGKASRTKLRAIIQDSHEVEHEDDGFGVNDADWDIYKSREAEEEELEVEMETLTCQLLQVESALEEHDQENFYVILEQEAKERRTVLDKLIYETPAGEYWLGVERIRVPEVLFQPGIIGQETCGLIECLLQVILQDQPVMLFITGGWKLTGLKERLQKDLMANLPQGTLIKIEDKGNHALSTILGMMTPFK